MDISMFRPIPRKLFDNAPAAPEPEAPDMEAEEAYHREPRIAVAVCRKRLESFLASSPEIKAICAALPFGHGITLPLCAYQEGIQWDSWMQGLISDAWANEDAEMAAEDEETA
jgi:hypothetical protein